MALNNFRSQMLWDNIRKADLSAVVNLLENGTINLEERDDSGQTFLMLACQQGEISLVRELLEAGIDCNATDNDNWSALMYSAKDGYLEICIELLERGADIDHRDLCKWTALMWASYKGRYEVVQELLERGADPNVKAEHNMSCLGWAAGRGHTEVVKALIEKGAKVSSTDKYGTSPLLWASRKGHVEIVQELLSNGAHVDSTGMDSLTALLVATRGGYTEVVQALLEYDPNVNAVDKDGFTALTIAAKEGYEDISQELLAKDAYVNIADRAGDTILIHAVKGGYTSIVRALLNRYADVDVEGVDRKTALYWAVEKGHDDIVQLLLDNDADLEICTKDGDTALMRAVRSRHELIVRQLLDKGAKVAVYDKKGDTALHISLRARSKRITELLLRNPRNSRLLYRPNKSGETPYSIDAYHQKGILTQIHGHRQLNAADGENLLGYEIYSSSLADILSEPSLNTPITVGLYAKWGSGKSFLIGKLKSEMKSFTKANEESQLEFTWSLFIFLLIINCLIGSILAITVMYQVGLGVGFGLFIWEYTFLGIIFVCSTRYNVRLANQLCLAIGKRLQMLTLLLQLLFCHPVHRSSNSSTQVPLVKFLFSENTKLTSVGGEKALGAMIAGLSESVEKEFGVVSARLYSVMKQASEKNYIGRFKTLCCIPIFVIVMFILLCFVAGVGLFVHYRISDKYANGFMISFACVFGLSLLSNIHNLGKAVIALIVPQKRRIMQAVDRVHRLKLDGFMQVLKREVGLMNNLVRTVDRFTRNTTRLVVVVDGLDTCEQEKVLQVLDIIHSLFNEENSSFVVILAVDPQIIIKGIDQNLKTQFHDTNVNGFDYLRNIVHLPFYLQSQGIQVKKQDFTKSVSSYDVNHESPTHTHKTYRHQESTVSQISGFTVVDQGGKKGRNSRQHHDSITQVTHSNFDISHTLTKNDYFSDINPKSMRRLMNIVAVTGRLLRAYNIDFNWYRLAAWVNLVEQWPYRLSWIILYFEEHEELGEDITLKIIYEKIENQMPGSSDIEPLLEIDRNVRKLQAFLSSKKTSSPSLNISDLKKFLPCTINLDPYLRKLIRNLQNQMQAELPLGLYSPPPNPPSNANTDLTDNRFQLRQTRTLNRQTLTPMYPPGMMPYGPMMYPGMMGMAPAQLLGMAGAGTGNTETSASKKSPNPGQYIMNYKSEVLSKMSTQDIASLLQRISGLNIHQLPMYQQAVLDNNINGAVLNMCDIDELGKCLAMKFGDWQLFKSAIQALRAAESNPSAATGGESNEPSNSGPVKGTRGATESTKSIHFTKPEVSEHSKRVRDEDGPMRLKNKQSTLTRQPSIDTMKDGASNSGGAFETIKEEGESLRRSDSSKVICRKDSFVEQAIYESGLLHDFVQTFTEGVSEEDESDDVISESEHDLIDMKSNNAIPPKKPPVHFQLSLGSSDDKSLPDDIEKEPLIQTAGTKSNSSTSGFPSSTPILKLPKLKTPEGFEKMTSKRSFPYLETTQESEVTVHHELQPLIPSGASSKEGSMCSGISGGFDTTHSDIGTSSKSRSTESFEMLSVVDETKDNKDGNVKSSGSGGKGASIEESIQVFTRTSLGATGSANSPERETSQMIQYKGKKDKDTPESFV